MMFWKSADSQAIPLALALQGGGPHGAYTSGVLQALLASHRVRPTAVSGTSAGAVNAVVMAHGWLQGGAAYSVRCAPRIGI